MKRLGLFMKINRKNMKTDKIDFCCIQELDSDKSVEKFWIYYLNQ